MRELKYEVVLVDMSGIYSDFRPCDSFVHIDCTDIEGTDCYCDSEACDTIVQRLSAFNFKGIHFIDTGNSHYITLFWVQKIEVPFSLLLFDHHPDIQPPRFEGLISCGGWVRDMLLSNKMLRHVYMVGISDRLACEAYAFSDRITIVDETGAALKSACEIVGALHIDTSVPLYVSIDKDVLCPCCAVTNWDQGSMTTEKLLSIIAEISRNVVILGADICGGLTDCNQRETAINAGTDKMLLKMLTDSIS